MNTRTEPAFDLEAWGKPTPEQAELYRRFGPRRKVHRDDPIREVPYDERTVRQIIYTFSKVNPAWFAQVQTRSTPRQLAGLLAWIAHERGYGLDRVMGRAEANRLEETLDRIATHRHLEDPPALRDLNREERAAWCAWWDAEQARPVEQRGFEPMPVRGAR